MYSIFARWPCWQRKTPVMFLGGAVAFTRWYQRSVTLPASSLSCWEVTLQKSCTTWTTSCTSRAACCWTSACRASTMCWLLPLRAARAAAAVTAASPRSIQLTNRALTQYQLTRCHIRPNISIIHKVQECHPQTFLWRQRMTIVDSPGLQTRTCFLVRTPPAWFWRTLLMYLALWWTMAVRGIIWGRGAGYWS